MITVDEFIGQLCPDGVEFFKIGELAEVGTGSSDRKNAVDGGRFPFYVRSQSVMRIESYEFDEEAILIPGEGGIGEIFHYVQGKYALHQRAYRIHFIDERVNTRFAYFYFNAKFKRFIMQKAVSATVTSIRKPMITDFLLPVPPLPVQQEIVRILDKFTQLEAELEAELEARKKQYDHYRERLLLSSDESVEVVALGDLGRIVTGRTPRSSDASSWGSSVDFVTPSDIKDGMKYVYAPNRCLSDAGAESLAKTVIPANSLLVTCIGADMGKTVINANDCVTNQQINSIILKPGVSNHYLFHVLTCMRSKLLSLGSQGSGTMPILNKSGFSRVKVSLPPFFQQISIAEKLDKLDALVNDFSSGLPAEIAARRKQYEYYRDQLLTFRELAS